MNIFAIIFLAVGISNLSLSLCFLKTSPLNFALFWGIGCGLCLAGFTLGIAAAFMRDKP